MSENSKPTTLGEKPPQECARVRGLIRVYREHCGQAGAIAVLMMDNALMEADRAMISGDATRMIEAYQHLRTFTD